MQGYNPSLATNENQSIKQYLILTEVTPKCHAWYHNHNYHLKIWLRSTYTDVCYILMVCWEGILLVLICSLINKLYYLLRLDTCSVRPTRLKMK